MASYDMAPPPSYPAATVEQTYIVVDFSVIKELNWGTVNYSMKIYADDKVLDELSLYFSTAMPNQKQKRKQEEHCMKVEVGSGISFAQVQIFQLLARRGFSLKAANAMHVPPKMPCHSFTFAR